jgi:hypothetical protein
MEFKSRTINEIAEMICGNFKAASNEVSTAQRTKVRSVAIYFLLFLRQIFRNKNVHRTLGIFPPIG